jgi:glutamate-1-semialdehyde aminotransferase
MNLALNRQENLKKVKEHPVETNQEETEVKEVKKRKLSEKQMEALRKGQEALLIKKGVAESFEPGDHASTFGGNPLATAAAVAAFTTILDEGMLENCQKMGDYFLSQLERLSKRFPFIKEVRGKGQGGNSRFEEAQ